MEQRRKNGGKTIYNLHFVLEQTVLSGMASEFLTWYFFEAFESEKSLSKSTLSSFPLILTTRKILGEIKV